MKTSNILSTEITKRVPESLWKSFWWLIIILLLPSLIFLVFFGLCFLIIEGDNFNNKGFELWFLSISTFLTLKLLTPFITIPLLVKASGIKNKVNYLDYWALKQVNTKELIKCLILGLIFWLIATSIEAFFNVNVEQFLLDVKGAINSLEMVMLMLATICLVGPIVEELVFRGWLFRQIEQTKFGSIGALFLSSILFTVIHTQYDSFITVIMIFMQSLFLGFIRYKTCNISYSIVIHILFNSLTTITVFFFL